VTWAFTVANRFVHGFFAFRRDYVPTLAPLPLFGKGKRAGRGGARPSSVEAQGGSGFVSLKYARYSSRRPPYDQLAAGPRRGLVRPPHAPLLNVGCPSLPGGAHPHPPFGATRIHHTHQGREDCARLHRLLAGWNSTKLDVRPWSELRRMLTGMGLGRTEVAAASSCHTPVLGSLHGCSGVGRDRRHGGSAVRLVLLHGKSDRHACRPDRRAASGVNQRDQGRRFPVISASALCLELQQFA